MSQAQRLIIHNFSPQGTRASEAVPNGGPRISYYPVKPGNFQISVLSCHISSLSSLTLSASLTQLIYTECSDAHAKPRPIWTILSTLCAKTPLLPLHGRLLPWGSWDWLLSCDFSRFWFADEGICQLNSRPGMKFQECDPARALLSR